MAHEMSDEVITESQRTIQEAFFARIGNGSYTISLAVWGVWVWLHDVYRCPQDMFLGRIAAILIKIGDAFCA